MRMRVMRRTVTKSSAGMLKKRGDGMVLNKLCGKCDLIGNLGI